jgi:hypothetical protein
MFPRRPGGEYIASLHRREMASDAFTAHSSRLSARLDPREFEASVPIHERFVVPGRGFCNGVRAVA